ncbi:hypothetical protein J1605_015945 [Eschrichtius robustus]|uniref:Uncharacterized protein n=1 Tax=Eschrichtius robustus TaxID=9764 RepID=A0AB34G8D6_ESCRO|nr:hypothetical protein J1605_015945 [Eschrichtius robustus]
MGTGAGSARKERDREGQGRRGRRCYGQAHPLRLTLGVEVGPAVAALGARRCRLLSLPPPRGGTRGQQPRRKEAIMHQEKLAKLQAQVRVGGKGTARGKKKVVHGTATEEDRKLQFP